MAPRDLALVAVLLASLVVILIVLVFFLLVGRAWLKSFLNGAPVSVATLLGMLLRGTPRGLLVDAYIQLHHRGSPASLRDVERQYQAERHRIRGSGDLVDLVERRLREGSA